MQMDGKNTHHTGPMQYSHGNDPESRVSIVFWDDI